MSRVGGQGGQAGRQAFLLRAAFGSARRNWHHLSGLAPGPLRDQINWLPFCPSPRFAYDRPGRGRLVEDREARRETVREKGKQRA
jgi:hypothetical protein